MKLGDYCVLPKFTSDFDKDLAEDLISKVKGPSFKEIEERTRKQALTLFPRHQVTLNPFVSL